MIDPDQDWEPASRKDHIKFFLILGICATASLTIGGLLIWWFN